MRSMSKRWWLGWVVAGTLTGCDAVEAIRRHEAQVALPPATIRPARSPIELLSLQVQGERSATTIARALGATVDELLHDNQLLPGAPLQDGVLLQVRTRPEVLAAYIKRRQEAREAAERAAAKRAEEEEAKRLALLADAKAKRAQRRALRDRGVKGRGAATKSPGAKGAAQLR